MRSERASLILRRLLPQRLVGPTLLWAAFHKGSLMSEFGYGESLKTRLPRSEKGEPLPWLPYIVAELLKDRLRPDMTVFEYGGGSSTRFFMSRVATVTTVEHDESWYHVLQSQAGKNVKVIHHDASASERYAKSIIDQGMAYDLVLVDGIARPQCFSAALLALSPRGVIILDDSHRSDYAPCFDAAKSAAFKELTLTGHKPGSIGLHRSTIFYRSINCLSL